MEDAERRNQGQQFGDYEVRHPGHQRVGPRSSLSGSLEETPKPNGPLLVAAEGPTAVSTSADVVRTRSSPAEAAAWDASKAHDSEPENHADVELPHPVQAILTRERIYRHLLAYADAVGALTAIGSLTALTGAHFRAGFLAAPLFAVLVGKVQGLYDRDEMSVSKSTVREWRAVLQAATLATIATYLIWAGLTAHSEGRGIRVFVFLMLITFLVTLPGRAVARATARRLAAAERCLVIGDPPYCSELCERLSEVPGIELVGTLSIHEVECSVSGIRNVVEELNVHRIVIGPGREPRPNGTVRLVQSAKWLGVRVSLMPSVMTAIGATTAVDELDSLILLGIPRFGLTRSSAILKRALDVVGATVGLIVATPLLLLTAIAIRLDTPGPVLFRQTRVGRSGQPFTMYKLRSMVDGADQMRSELLKHNRATGLFKLADDPRITRVGRLLRRTYLDELPQLLNVLRGDMSLVGPRPLVEDEDALLQGFDRHRTRLRPGMTGPWQLRGPLNASLQDLAKLDYVYAANWSIWADVDIMVGTLTRILRQAGH